MKEDKEPVPAPSALKSVDPVAVAKELEFEPGECFVNIVTVDAEEYAKWIHVLRTISTDISAEQFLFLICL